MRPAASSPFGLDRAPLCARHYDGVRITQCIQFIGRTDCFFYFLFQFPSLVMSLAELFGKLGEHVREIMKTTRLVLLLGAAVSMGCILVAGGQVTVMAWASPEHPEWPPSGPVAGHARHSSHSGSGPSLSFKRTRSLETLFGQPPDSKFSLSFFLSKLENLMFSLNSSSHRRIGAQPVPAFYV